jgi:hypothetical protein
MAHVVHIRSKEQFIKALDVLIHLPGTWQGRGTSADRVLLLQDSHYNALVEAGVIPANDKLVKSRGKKRPTKNSNLKQGLDRLRQRYGGEGDNRSIHWNSY